MRTSEARVALPALLCAFSTGAAQGYPLDAVCRPAGGEARRASSGLFDPESNRDPYHVAPGQRLVLAELEGPGEIRHIWFTLASRDRRYPRSMVLRIYWDGAEVPSVESPIGDFFAAGNGMRAPVASLPIEVSSYGRALNSYWRMPFRKSARIEMHNEGTERTTVYFQCDWLKKAELPDDTLYFHARYHQEYAPEPFSYYTVIDVQGSGQYVGTVLSSQNNLASWFGESDDHVYIDGEEQPSLVGTGLEDYFNDAWNLRLFTHLRRGVTICETKGKERRITAYRWHLEDPIPFSESLKLQIERRSFIHAPDPVTGERKLYDFKYRPDDFSSVAFWYHHGVAPRAEELPPVAERIPAEVWVEVAEIAEDVSASAGLRPRNATNRTCNLKRFFYLRNDALDGWVDFPVSLSQRGRYSISVFQSLFREYGVWQVSLHGKGVDMVLHPALDFFDHLLSRSENWPENHHHGTLVETKVGVHWLEAGDYTMRFTCVGSNPQSRHPETLAFGQGMSLGLDALLFRKLRIDDPKTWMAQYLEAESELFAARVATAKKDVARLAAAVDAFAAENGRLPARLSDVAERVPRDPWGQQYRYRCPGLVHPEGYDLYSVHGNSRNPAVWIGNWSLPYAVSDGIEGESLRAVRSSEGVATSNQRVSSYGDAPLSAGRILFVRTNTPGDFVELLLPEMDAGRYRVHLLLATSWDYGVAQWSLNGQPLSPPFDAYSPTIGRARLPAAEVTLTAGAPVLRLQIIGANHSSAGFKAGLDAVVLVRLP